MTGADDSDDDDQGGDEGKREAGGGAPRVIAGAIEIRKPSAREVPPKLEWKSSDEELFGAATSVDVTRSGRVYGVGKPRRRPRQAGYVERGAYHPVAGEPLPNAFAGYFAAREDSEAGLIGFDCNSVWEITFAEARIRRLFRQGESLADIGYGPEGRILVLTADTLDIYRREGAGAVLERRWSIDGYGVRAARGGRLLFVSCFEGGDDGITVFGFTGRSLRRLARVAVSVSEIRVAGGRVFVEHTDGSDGDNIVELAGLDALLEQLDANPGAFDEVAVSTREVAEATDDASKGSDDDDDDDDSDESDDDENADSDDDSDDDDSDDDDSDDDDDDDDDDRPPPRARKGPSSFVVEPGPGRIGLVHVGRKSPIEAPEPPAIPRDVKSRFGTGSEIEVTPDGSIHYGWKKEGRRSFRFAAVMNDHFIEADVTSKSASTVMAIRSDGRRIVAASDGDKKLWTIDFPQARASLVHDFSGEKHEDEVYGVLPLAFDRILATTGSDAWLFSLAGGKPKLEARGGLGVHSHEVVLDGRAVVFQTTEGKPLRVWGVFEDGLRELAAFDVEPSELLAHNRRVLVKASGGHGWFELLGIEDTWKAAQRDAGGTRYPRVELKKKERAPDADDDDDENDDDYDDDDDDDDDE